MTLPRAANGTLLGPIYMSDEPLRQRVGVFGGTFDPIHLGHLLIAEHSREQLRLDQVQLHSRRNRPAQTRATSGRCQTSRGNDSLGHWRQSAFLCR